jgi:hypothetical protein
MLGRSSIGRVQNDFPSPWYVRRKPCTYLASRLTLSPNGPSFHLSLVTSEYHWVRPKRFLSRWYVWHKLCIYLAPTLTLSPNEKKWDFTRPTSPRSSSSGSKMILEPMVRLTQTVHLSCVHYLQKDQNKLALEPHHLVVPLSVSKIISELWYV